MRRVSFVYILNIRKGGLSFLFYHNFLFIFGFHRPFSTSLLLPCSMRDNIYVHNVQHRPCTIRQLPRLQFDDVYPVLFTPVNEVSFPKWGIDTNVCHVPKVLREFHVLFDFNINFLLFRQGSALFLQRILPFQGFHTLH